MPRAGFQDRCNSRSASPPGEPCKVEADIRGRYTPPPLEGGETGGLGPSLELLLGRVPLGRGPVGPHLFPRPRLVTKIRAARTRSSSAPARRPATPRVLLIGGSINQTTMLHQVGRALGDDVECVYTPYYTDGYLEALNRLGLLNFTVAGHGGQFRQKTEAYLRDQGLPVFNNYFVIRKWHMIKSC